MLLLKYAYLSGTWTNFSSITFFCVYFTLILNQVSTCQFFSSLRRTRSYIYIYIYIFICDDKADCNIVYWSWSFVDNILLRHCSWILSLISTSEKEREERWKRAISHYIICKTKHISQVNIYVHVHMCVYTFNWIMIFTIMNRKRRKKNWDLMLSDWHNPFRSTIV